MMPEISELQKKRAENIIWSCAESYAFTPDFKAYDKDGIADLYWNCIIGAVRKIACGNLIDHNSGIIVRMPERVLISDARILIQLDKAVRNNKRCPHNACKTPGSASLGRNGILRRCSRHGAFDRHGHLGRCGRRFGSRGCGRRSSYFGRGSYFGSSRRGSHGRCGRRFYAAVLPACGQHQRQCQHQHGN